MTRYIWLISDVLAWFWPPKKFTLNHTMIGQTAFVGSQGLSKSTSGEITWSGTIVRAQIDKKSAVDSLEAGSQVTITEVSGVTFMVKPA